MPMKTNEPEPELGSAPRHSVIQSSGTPATVRVLAFRVSDEELLERLRRDREAGWALLHARFHEEVNRLVWRLLGADHDHDDIVQQVFVKLMLKIDDVREPDKLGGWVRKTTVNHVYSELRKRAVRRLFVASQSVVPEQFEDAVRSAEARDLLARVYTELGRMPPAEHVAFSLRYIEGKALPEVAELCGCSLATVKRRIARASARLTPLQRDLEGLYGESVGA